MVLVTNETAHRVAVALGERGWSVVSMPAWVTRVSGLGLAGRLLRDLVGDQLAWSLYRRFRRFELDDTAIRPAARKFLDSIGVDLMVYSHATPLSYWGGTPYIMPIHDLQHRLNPRFPEVGANGQWEGRERLYRNASRSPLALGLLADSEVGKEDILQAYAPFGLTADKVKILPLVSPPYLGAVGAGVLQEVRVKYGLPELYVFYPAQFWPHKNHLRIVEALGLIRERQGARIPIVFCGSHSGRLRTATYRRVMSRARQLGLKDTVHYIGYAADSDMTALYSGAVALVMPTFFGPTNIPVVEAWQCGCPVITSDIRGIREHAGDAAVLVDPESADAIAAGIFNVWKDAALRRSLVDKGRRRLARYTEADFKERLTAVLEEAREVVSARSSLAT
jgi:glycosyltransferase involved in cell wall biosynthesis